MAKTKTKIVKAKSAKAKKVPKRLAKFRPMNVVVAPGSTAEKYYRAMARPLTSLICRDRPLAARRASARKLSAADRHGTSFRSAPSFRAFVESVEEEAEQGEVNEAPIVEEGSEGVRVMTVYKAKGPEFPVVILAAHRRRSEGGGCDGRRA